MAAQGYKTIKRAEKQFMKVNIYDKSPRFTFMFVRHPFERLVSAYYNKFVAGSEYVQEVHEMCSI